MAIRNANFLSSARSAIRIERSPSPVPTQNSVTMKLDEMRARIQIKQIRPKTALEESKRAEIIDKARLIQDKIARSHARDEECFQTLEERLSKLKASIEKTQLINQGIANSHPKDLNDIGMSFSKEISAESSQHYAQLTEAKAAVIDKSHALQSEFIHSISSAAAGFKKKEESLISDTETVAMAFQQQKRDRELFFESLISKLGGAMLNLHQRLIAEKAEREQFHRQRLKDIAEMRHRFAKAIEKENVKRKADREELVQVLEQITLSDFQV